MAMKVVLHTPKSPERDSHHQIQLDEIAEDEYVG